jgi:5-formyltetrahydrofolate cyclo-ligase
MSEPSPKAVARRALRAKLAAMSPERRHAKSAAAAAHATGSPAWASASVVMLFLSMPDEIETAPLALRAWQEGKSVVVPKVAWNQRRMLPLEIRSLSDVAVDATSGFGVREPVGGKPVPVGAIDLVFVPGLGFTDTGLRIGRGMGFYDRFLSQPGFLGTTCGYAFAEQVVRDLPVLEHDVALDMLVTDAGVHQFHGRTIGR